MSLHLMVLYFKNNFHVWLFACNRTSVWLKFISKLFKKKVETQQPCEKTLPKTGDPVPLSKTDTPHDKKKPA